MSSLTGDPIRPYEENPAYWQYRRRPVLLLGGSKTDKIFLLDDLKDHLDELVSVGGNYVRNTMSQRESRHRKAHRLLPSGRFDLDAWNDEYWQRFQNMLQWTYEREIFVQIEVWDRFDYSQDNWLHSPWSPANNANYTEAETGLALEQPEPAWEDVHPFFHTIPGMALYRQEYDRIRAYQERFVDKMLSHSLQYGHVLYCINNETGAPHAWGEHWLKHIRNRAAEAGAEVFVTDMFDAVYEPEECASFRYQLDNPHIYSFLDVSQVNSHSFGEAHWEKLQWIFAEVDAHVRPVNNTKIYGNGYTSFGSGGPQDGVERFMRDLIAGCASVRFHRPYAGIGLNAKAKGAIKAVRKVESLMSMWELASRMDLISSPGRAESCLAAKPDGQTAERAGRGVPHYNAAYLAAKPGEKYFLYFTYGDVVDLSLSGHPGLFRARWIDVNTGEWGSEARIEGGGSVTLRPPDSGGWIAAIVSE